MEGVGKELPKYLSDFQFGVGVSDGTEAVLHSFNWGLSEYHNDGSLAMLTMDFLNAFKLVDRSALLHEQGDPLGPLIFSLILHPLLHKIKDNCKLLLYVWYLYDETIIKDSKEVARELDIIKVSASGWFLVDIRRPSSGVKLLKGAVSRDTYFISGLGMRRAANSIYLMSRLPQLHDMQSELLLLRSCIVDAICHVCRKACLYSFGEHAVHYKERSGFKVTIQLENAVSTISQEYLLEFTFEYGIPKSLHPELSGSEDRIVEFPKGKSLPNLPLTIVSDRGGQRWRSFSKRQGKNTPQCYTKPLDSLKNWNNRFFWVDEKVFPTVMDWRTNAPKDEIPSADFILWWPAPNPTKVKTRTRPRAAHEVPLLTATANRVIDIRDTTVTSGSSGTPAVIEKSPLHFADKDPPPIITERCDEATAERGNEGAEANAPPKVLRKDHVVSCLSHSTLGGKSLAAMGIEAHSTGFIPVIQKTPVNAKSVSDPDPLSYAGPRPIPEQDIAYLPMSCPLGLLKVRNPKDPWSFKEEILLEDVIAANISRAEKKKKCRVVCRTHMVSFAHHTRFDTVPVSVPTIAPQGLVILLADVAIQIEIT
nr:hypothetical protein [Tanacetum cinerariifolium]